MVPAGSVKRNPASLRPCTPCCTELHVLGARACASTYKLLTSKQYQYFNSKREQGSTRLVRPRGYEAGNQSSNPTDCVSDRVRDRPVGI
jgi:hypothetical protein